MFHCKTLSIYLFALYLRYFSAIFLTVTGILALSNIFDVLQKFKDTSLSAKFFWNFVLYKIPYLLNEIAPLISFLAMLFLIRRLTEYNELVIILTSGISLQRVLLVIALAAGMLGLLVIAILNPIGTCGLQRYKSLENKLTKQKQQNVTALQDQFLVFENYHNNNRIIAARSVNLATRELKQVTLLFVDADNNFIQRIDASSATLTQGKFYLHKVKVASKTEVMTYEKLTVATNLSIDNCTHITSPEMTSIWYLKGSIDKLLNCGLPVIDYQIYYYKQLFKPLLMMATVVLASCFISLRGVSNAQKKIFALGTLTGFTAYLLIEIAAKILAYNGLQPALAILLPILLLMLISNFVVLHLN